MCTYARIAHDTICAFGADASLWFFVVFPSRLDGKQENNSSPISHRGHHVLRYFFPFAFPSFFSFSSARLVSISLEEPESAGEIECSHRVAENRELNHFLPASKDSHLFLEAIEIKNASDRERSRVMILKNMLRISFQRSVQPVRCNRMLITRMSYWLASPGEMRMRRQKVCDQGTKKSVIKNARKRPQ